MNDKSSDEVRAAVREQYGAVAKAKASSCAPGCCGPNASSSLGLGYSEGDLASVDVLRVWARSRTLPMRARSALPPEPSDEQAPRAAPT